MRTDRVTFEGSRGDRLAGRVERPASGPIRGWALFAHCFTCSKNVKAAVHVSRGLAGEGFGVLRFDFTGLGESEGEFGGAQFSSNVEDLVAASRFMAEELGSPSLLVGHSLGGAAVLHAAREIRTVRAVATIGAPSEPAHVLRHLEGALDEIEAEGEARVRIGGRSFPVRRSFLRDLESSRMEEAVGGLGRALLLFHAPRDRIVGIENAARLYEMARHPKSFVSLDDADHLLGDPEDSAYVARVLGSWAARYLEAPAEVDTSELRAGDRVVVRGGTERYRTEVGVRGHTLVADEPRAVGGTDEGPTPYDLLAAGLGACTAMTLRMYADRKGWPLEGVGVRLRHRRLHGEDERECEEDGDARLDVLEREIRIEGPELTGDQRQRLLEIADRCPVHRTLDAGVRIETRSMVGEGD